jgi:hypothetical protein
MGAPRAFALLDDAIEWRRGTASGRIPYAQVRYVRMAYRPVSMQSQRFLTEIWAEGGVKMTIVSTSARGMMEQERLDGPYTAFIVELHRRVAHAGGRTQFVQGFNPLLYWAGVVMFAAAGLGLAGLTARAAQASLWLPAAFIAAFFAFFLWQGGNYFSRNRPRAYSPDSLPEGVMPKI